jgi:hypothetical protein
MIFHCKDRFSNRFYTPFFHDEKLFRGRGGGFCKKAPTSPTPCGKVQAVQNAIFGESCIRKRGSYPKAKKESFKRKSFPQSASPFSSAYPLFPTQVKTRKSAWQKGLRVFHSFHGPYYYYY